MFRGILFGLLIPISSQSNWNSACQDGSCLFAADTLNHRIQIINVKTSNIITLAGGSSTQQNYRDGSGYDAIFYYPLDICIMKNETNPNNTQVIVADSYNNLIRSIDLQSAKVTTIAGSPSGGFNDGDGINALFRIPSGIAVTPSGLVVIIDSQNFRVRLLDINTKIVTTLAGSGNRGYKDGIGSNAEFAFSVSPIGMPTCSRDNCPRNLFLDGIAVSSTGIIYISDSFNNRIRSITENGNVTTVAGSIAGFQDGFSSMFNFPLGISITKDDLLIIADPMNQRIRFLNTTTGQVSSFQSPSLQGLNSLSISDDQNTLFFSDIIDDKIQKLDLPSKSTASINENSKSLLNKPSSIVLIPNSDFIFVSDTFNHRIVRINSKTDETAIIAGSGLPLLTDGIGNLASFNRPQGLATISSSIIAVSDSENCAIRYLDVMTGSVQTIAGGQEGYLDGPAKEAKFKIPSAIALTLSGNLVIADKLNHVIRMLDTTSNNVTTLVGNNAKIGFEDGIGYNATFDSPIGIAIDSLGVLYVIDSGNCGIRSINLDTRLVKTISGKYCDALSFIYKPTGIVALSPTVLVISAINLVQYVNISESDNIKFSTIAGKNRPGFTDGLAASFQSPQGLALTYLGDIYLADQGNNVVRFINTTSRITSSVGNDYIRSSVSALDHPGGIAFFTPGDDFKVCSADIAHLCSLTDPVINVRHISSYYESISTSPVAIIMSLLSIILSLIVLYSIRSKKMTRRHGRIFRSISIISIFIQVYIVILSGVKNGKWNSHIYGTLENQIKNIVRENRNLTIETLDLSPSLFVFVVTGSNVIQIFALFFFLLIILTDCCMFHLVEAMNPSLNPLFKKAWTAVCVIIYLGGTAIDNYRNVYVILETIMTLKVISKDVFSSTFLNIDFGCVIGFILFASLYDIAQNLYLCLAFYSRRKEKNFNQWLRLGTAISMVLLVFILDFTIIVTMAGSLDSIIYSIDTGVDIAPAFAATLGFQSSILVHIYLWTKEIMFPSEEEDLSPLPFDIPLRRKDTNQLLMLNQLVGKKNKSPELKSTKIIATSLGNLKIKENRANLPGNLKTKQTRANPRGTKETSANPRGTKETSANPRGTKETSANPRGTKETSAHPRGTKETSANPRGTKETSANPRGTKDTRAIPREAKDTRAISSKSLKTIEIAAFLS